MNPGHYLPLLSVTVQIVARMLVNGSHRCTRPIQWHELRAAWRSAVGMSALAVSG